MIHVSPRGMVQPCAELSAVGHYTEFSSKDYAGPNCGKCFDSCRAEPQAPLTLRRVARALGDGVGAHGAAGRVARSRWGLRPRAPGRRGGGREAPGPAVAMAAPRAQPRRPPPRARRGRRSWCGSSASTSARPRATSRTSPSGSSPPCVASGFVLFALQSLRWHAVMRPLLGLRYAEAYRAQVVGFMFNQLLPMRGGDLLRVQYLGRRTGKSRAAILGTEVVDRWLDLLGADPDAPRPRAPVPTSPPGCTRPSGSSPASCAAWPSPSSCSPAAASAPRRPRASRASSTPSGRASRPSSRVASWSSPSRWRRSRGSGRRSSSGRSARGFGIHLGLGKAFCVLVGFNAAMVVPSPGALGTLESGRHRRARVVRRRPRDGVRLHHGVPPDADDPRHPRGHRHPGLPGRAPLRQASGPRVTAARRPGPQGPARAGARRPLRALSAASTPPTAPPAAASSTATPPTSTPASSRRCCGWSSPSSPRTTASSSPQPPAEAMLTRLHDDLYGAPPRSTGARSTSATARGRASSRSSACSTRAACRGRLFDPDAYPFLEGRPPGDRGPAPREVPRVPDGAVLRVLDLLLLQDGERVSYRDLEVEHVGGVYEDLLALRGRRRARGRPRAPAGRGAAALRRALHLAGDGRRSSSSARSPPCLGDAPTPDAILALRVCDPAMGSGAFLVEACRQLAAHLVRAWERAGAAPPHDADDDPLLHARRLVARRCLYGVDKNPLAVDLARLSLWLVTLARALPLSFVDHALRHGDSLVGLGPRASSPPPRSTGPTRPWTGCAPRATSCSRPPRRGRGPAAPKARARAPGRPRPPKPSRACSKAARRRRTRLSPRPCAPTRALPLGDRAPRGLRRGPRRLRRHRRQPALGLVRRAAPRSRSTRDLRELYTAHEPAFAGYRNLQGVFVHRAATLLAARRPPRARAAHLHVRPRRLRALAPRARRARRAATTSCPTSATAPSTACSSPPWPSSRRAGPRPSPRGGRPRGPSSASDLDADGARSSRRLGACPGSRPHLFGERGFQTHGRRPDHLHALPGPEAAVHDRPSAWAATCALPARARRGATATRRAFGGRLRSAASLPRGRRPDPPDRALPDGRPLDGGRSATRSSRASPTPPTAPHVLLAYLNAAPVRYLTTCATATRARACRR